METELKSYQNETKMKLKNRFPTLTDEDLNFREGREKEMMQMLANKLEISHIDLIGIIDSL